MNMFVNVADLPDPSDKEGRSYREVNEAMEHKVPVGARVETYDNMVLFVTKHTRDCDGTPLYSLGNDDGQSYAYGYAEDSITNLEASAYVV